MKRKHCFVFCLGVLVVMLLTGCHTPTLVPSWDFGLPNGFNTRSRDTSVVNLDFTLQGDGNLTASMMDEIHESIEHYFRKSKRFAIFWQKNQEVREDVVINAHLETMTAVNAVESAMGAKVTLSAMCNLHNGMAGESILVTGFSTPDRARNTFIPPMQFSVSKHFTMALKNALGQLQLEIEKLYPISATVTSYRCNGNGDVKLIISIGTNYGLSDEYEYVVCCKEGDDVYFVLGLADGVPGAEMTQMRMLAFNTGAPDFDNSVYSRILQNDKKLCEEEKLFVVARRKKYNK